MTDIQVITISRNLIPDIMHYMFFTLGSKDVKM